jgi:hypothetical protein
MSATTVCATDFDLDCAKKSAEEGPVFLSEDGHKTHVLLSIDAYKKLSHEGLSILDLLYYPPLANVDPDFEFPRLDGPFKAAEFD